MANKQAVVETTRGTFVIALLAGRCAEPRRLLHEAGAGRRVRRHDVPSCRAHGIIQGGDPLSKDPAKAARYGTGGLGVLKAELNAEAMARGAVAAVLQPGQAGQRAARSSSSA